MDKKGGVSRFSVEKFLSHSAEFFRRGIFSVSLIWGIENLLGIREGRDSRFSVEIVLSHSAEISRRGII